MADHEIRKLERQAAMGDADAEEALKRARLRAGLMAEKNTLAPWVVADFMFAGRAVVTFQNVKTKKRATFRLLRKKPGRKQPQDPRAPFDVHVRLEDGWRRLGYLVPETDVPPARPAEDTLRWEPEKDELDEERRVLTTLLGWVYSGDIPEHIITWHEGNCGCCSKPLTEPESIRTGIGPKCAARRRRDGWRGDPTRMPPPAPCDEVVVQPAVPAPDAEPDQEPVPPAGERPPRARRRPLPHYRLLHDGRVVRGGSVVADEAGHIADALKNVLELIERDEGPLGPGERLQLNKCGTFKILGREGA